MNMLKRRIALAVGALALALCFGTGCSSYSLKGKVIEGDISYVAIVGQDDPRLQQEGIGSVSLRLETDPDKISRETAGEGLSQADGSFSVPFNQMGGGVLLYDVGLSARKPGYETVEHAFRLPPKNRRILVIMRPGSAGPEEGESTYEQYERFR